ncbi:unnamed protein product [Litomosoides sigmodontis]|uniref:HMG box domain-containing protein n=1 Tax=Litomosoides sigmodontis TaxID=42156 RepID=A0A3P6V2U6_LITSI|nr:unnamed protein product [Litomosoides sigmodontis]
MSSLHLVVRFLARCFGWWRETVREAQPLNKMTKKRSPNGFMYFAGARRAVYEAENPGAHLTAKKLVQRATRDWKLMSEDERQNWRSESRRRRDEYGRQVCQTQSISVSITAKSKTRPLSKLELSLQPKPFSCRLTESKRKSIRRNVYQKLIWREKENMTEALVKKRFGLLTVRPLRIFELSSAGDGLICPPVEICTFVMSLNEGIVGSQRILIHHDYLTNNQFHQFPQTSENGFSQLSEMSSHSNVHHACHRIANEMRGCWANLILVPASQYQTLAASLAWIKQKRDTVLERDTASIRGERLICMEDMITVIARIVETDVDGSSSWEQNISPNFCYACDLHAAAPSTCAMVVGKSACQHFLGILRNLADCSHGTREKCIFKISDAKVMRYFNPFPFPMRHNRTNPFRMVSYCNPKDNRTIDDEPFSLIQLRTPDKMEYVTEWLNALDINTEMLESDIAEQSGFQTN